VLLFAAALGGIAQALEPAQPLIQQWLASILLGAVNVEQSKFLNLEDLDLLLGTTTKSLATQRVVLKCQATPIALASLFRWNYHHLCQPPAAATSATSDGHAASQHDFYLDPHTKHYTGMQAVLKGWCAAIRWADKLINSDYIHNAHGQPIYFECGDNFEDLRSRFIPLVERFHATLELPASQPSTFILDRGIYGNDLFNHVLAHPHIHLITWEKGYHPAPWDPASATGSTRVAKCRNHATDLRHYTFSWKEEPWPQNPQIRRIIVAATNPAGATHVLAILATDPHRPAAAIIHRIFNRWIQENDFKYLDKHFGINQITSYRSTPYTQLRASLNDRLVPNHLWQQKHREGQQITKKHHRLLAAADTSQRQEQARQARIQELHSQLAAPPPTPEPVPATAATPNAATAAQATLKKELTKHQEASKRATRYQKNRETKLEETYQQLRESQAARDELAKEVSRLDQLEGQDKVRLETGPKSLLDGIRIIARNSFYRLLEPFKKAYDNYRDDHDYFRYLTQSGGLLTWTGTEMEVHLTPQVNYQPKLKELLQTVLKEYNQQEPTMPDGSGRKLSIHLADWNEFEIKPRQ
jgi:hypothetical protein